MVLSSTIRTRGAAFVGGGLGLGSGLGTGLEAVSLPDAEPKASEMLVFRARVGRIVGSFCVGRFFRISARIRETDFLSLCGPHGRWIISMDVARDDQVDLRDSWSTDVLQRMSSGGSVVDEAGGCVASSRSPVRRISIGSGDGHETSSKPYHFVK